MLNFLVCHQDAAIAWQWDLVGQRIRDAATPRLRELLGGHLSVRERAEIAGREPTTSVERAHALRSHAWPALPDDWRE